MPLLSYDPMADGNAASANLWNVRLSKIHDLLNGNLDAANLANGAVTTPKIADGAVTSAKIATSKTTDNNGWVVNDMGTFKTWTYSYTVTGVSIGSGVRKDNLPQILPPEGQSRDNLIYTCTWYGGYSSHAIPGIEPGTASNLAVMLANQYNTALTFTGKIFIIAVVG